MKLCYPKKYMTDAFIGCTLCAIIIGVSPTAEALDPNTTDPKQIIDAVEKQESGDRMVSKVTMTLTDSAGRTRERSLRSRAMKFKGGNKMLMLFESPSDMRNTGLLTIDYRDKSKNDDQWLYLPSLRKTTRIASSDRTGSFLGSDLTYADMMRKDRNAYDYKLVEQSVTVDGEECWLIEARPKSEEEIEKTGYIKMLSWVSKNRLIAVQGKMWVREGKKLKYIKLSEIKKVNGIWVPYKTSVRTMNGGKVQSTTVMKTDEIKFNDPTVKDSDFTERRLEKGL